MLSYELMNVEKYATWSKQLSKVSEAAMWLAHNCVF